MVTAGLVDAHAGTTHVVTRLAQQLAESGARVTVFSAELNARTSLPDVTPAKIVSVPFFSFRGRKMVAPSIRRELTSVPADWVHVHGFWLHPFVSACFAGKALDAQILLSPHGMFSQFSFRAHGTRKRIALRLGFSQALRRIDCFHATSVGEYEEIRKLGLKQPIHLIPHGIDLPELITSKCHLEEHVLLFLSRLHPKKGLMLLLEAWGQIAALRPQWRLQIVGPDEGGHGAELQQFIARRGLPRVSLMGPCYGAVRDALMRNASLFVLPSYDENFGLVIGEALACETPVLTTTRTPWKMLEAKGCGWCVPATLESITSALATATALDVDKLHEMGRRGRIMINQSFSWSRVSQRFLERIFDDRSNGIIDHS